jgi:pimeloyl-ACP methyl ester carboxylesterase
VSQTLHRDDDLRRFAAEGVALPAANQQGNVEHDGARCWYASFGAGSPVFLLHGGLGHSGNWGYQIDALLANGYRVITIDSRGHGRSTRDDRPYSYQLMASDLLAVMDSLDLQRAALAGWSDGAVVALTAAMQAPTRVSGVFFFACSVDPSGTLPLDQLPPTVKRCFERHKKDYATLSATPGDFDSFHHAVTLMMKTQPNYVAEELARIQVPVTVVHAEHDEFIRPEHAEYLARTIPGAKLVELDHVSHFAPLQRPDVFNQALLQFLAKL